MTNSPSPTIEGGGEFVIGQLSFFICHFAEGKGMRGPSPLPPISVLDEEDVVVAQNLF
jgi:hypothetical protein